MDIALKPPVRVISFAKPNSGVPQNQEECKKRAEGQRLGAASTGWPVRNTWGCRSRISSVTYSSIS